ncbi:MAG TPA: trigger factor [Bacteroidota bacterium]|nr:trigger factor [Bacteroidota bacterium]
MEVSLKTVTECDQEIAISLSPEELAPHFEAAYKKAAPSIEIKGFRKGKVPISLIKKYYGESVEADALDDIANESFKKTIEEKKIQPIGTPTIVDMKYKRGEPFSFTIKYEVKPSITLKDYKSIPVEKYVHPVKDEEVESEIKRLQHINATFEEAKKVDGPEYVVTADLQDTDETGTPLIGQKRDGMRIYLNEPSTEQEIKDALRSAEVGGVYKVSFEHKHDDHTHKVHMQMTVKKVEKVIHPDFNDELVKKITKEKYSNAAEFRKELRADLERYWNDRTDKRMVDDLTNEIVRRHEFAVPEALVKSFTDSYIDELKNQQKSKQLPRGFDEQKYREAARPTAVWQAKWALIREQILAKENIKVEDADVETLAEEESKKLNIDKERLMNFYKTSETAGDRILNDKLIAFLKQNSAVKETVTDDTTKLLS